MDTDKVIRLIMEAAKPLTVTGASRAKFVNCCECAGIKLNADLEILGSVNEQQIESLVDCMDSAMLKMVIRKVLREI